MQFKPQFLINAAMIAICFLYTLTLFIASILKKNKTMMSLPFISLCGSIAVQLLCGAAAWLYTPGLYSLSLYKVIYSADFLMSYLLSGVGYWYFSTYIHALKNPNIHQRKPIDRGKLIFFSIYGFLLTTFFISSMWTGWFFVFDEVFLIEVKSSYLILSLLSSIWSYLCIVMIIRERKILGRFNTSLLLAYSVTPVIAFTTDAIDGLALGYVVSALIFFIIYVRIDNAQGVKLLEQQANLARKDAEMSETKMDLMMSQIQPHFLYNALSSISYLCTENPQEARDATNEFSEYLRGNLQFIGSKSPIPFEIELEHVNHYLNIEKRRFPDRLIVEMNIRHTNFMIPALTMQTLVENAVKYGVNAKYEPTTVRIETEETDAENRIIIKDDGPGFDTEAKPKNDRRHIGLEGARFRLREMVGGTLTIDSTIGVGSTITIHIPKERSI